MGRKIMTEAEKMEKNTIRRNKLKCNIQSKYFTFM